ncbi:MAG: spore cortex-lytic enzyme [Eubacteriales bacterium]
MDIENTRKKILIFGVAILSVMICLVFAVNGNAALGDRQLAKGSKGPEVEELQKKLNQLGYNVGAVDGVFGKKTDEAVKQLQKDRGIEIDGVVGEVTVEQLKNLTGESKTASGKAVGFKNADSNLLARCVSAEARGEPYMGQVAVAAVIMNRIKSSSFPNSIADIVYQPKAFSSVEDGQINDPPLSDAVKAAKEAMSGQDPTHGAIYFFNPDKTKNKFVWSRPQIMKIGNHIFAR